MQFGFTQMLRDRAALPALAIAMFAAIPTSASFGQVPCRYTVEYLPSPPPCQFWERYIETSGISPNGRYVCGWIDDCSVGNYAVVVDTQTMQTTIIPRPPAVVSMRAHGINDKNEATGTMTMSSGGPYHAFLWRNGEVVDIGLPSTATFAEAHAINNKTEIAGYWGGLSAGYHAYVWKNGEFVDLRMPGGGEWVAHDIGEDSKVVGWRWMTEAKLWIDSKVIGLGLFPGGTWSIAYSIAPNGSIAGAGTIPDAASPSGYRARAFLYTNGQLQNLGVLPGALDSRAFANNDWAAVGVCNFEGDSAAFVFANGVMRRIENLQPDSDLLVYEASGIGDDGSVSANGRFGFSHHGLVLRPVYAPPGDIDASCHVNVVDLLAVISAWGSCDPDWFCPADVNNDAVVDVWDIVLVVQNWGPGEVLQ
jgi:uncharacterized membrane protein